WTLRPRSYFHHDTEQGGQADYFSVSRFSAVPPSSALSPWNSDAIIRSLWAPGVPPLTPFSLTTSRGPGGAAGPVALESSSATAVNESCCTS
ncbi:hypothetical protein, partial [Nocardia brasiliensis]|uniref:hypothetical protein n=1 Tax=Nocardia brasiliensis TaxID=37326 RepID=UPI002455135A